MHGMENFKIIDAKEAKLTNYTRIKHKLLKTSAAVWVKKICRNNQPSYVNFKIKHNSQRNKNTQTSYKTDGLVLVI
jgi:uncharacterized protein (UPF0333 family)